MRALSTKPHFFTEVFFTTPWYSRAEMIARIGWFSGSCLETSKWYRTCAREYYEAERPCNRKTGSVEAIQHPSFPHRRLETEIWKDGGMKGWRVEHSILRRIGTTDTIGRCGH